MFTHLHTHSNYSFGAGAIPPDELPKLAVSLGMKSVALTDTNNMSAALEFYLAAKDAGIKPILGVELKTRSECVVLLAKNADGYAEICAVTTSVLEAIPQIKPKITFEMLIGSVEVIAEERSLASSLLPFLVGLSKNVFILSSSEAVLERLGECKKSNVFIELVASEQRKWKLLRGILARHRIPVVATNNVFFAQREDYEFHRVLRAIGLNTNIGKLPASELAHPTQYFCGEDQLRVLFGSVAEDVFVTTEWLANQCNVEFEFSGLRFATYPCESPEAMLRTLAEEGFRNRYLHPTSVHFERFEFELSLIFQMKATSYFLSVHDMIEYAKRKNYPYLGRGSGANSLVAYCLEISNVDPIENNLRFERFLNPERTMPPDFDIDFSWKDRYDVINYMLDTYGRDRTAMLCTIQTYRDKATVREVGKALGYGESEINGTISRLGELYHTAQHKRPTRVSHSNGLDQVADIQEWMYYAARVTGFPHHLSVHAGGLIIADRTMNHYTPVQQAPIGVPIMQQDMFTADDWKLVKLDILATRGLGTYWDTMNMVKSRTGEFPPVTDVQVALNDPPTRELVRSGNSKGCFYIESPAMISLLRKLEVDTFSMLTAASSVIRPGVASSGMMASFIERHHHPEMRTHLIPKMGELLSETYGIMIYQEDVLTVVHELAGLTYGEADLFRRAMSGKLRSKDFMAGQRERFVSGCMKNGISLKIADELWRQVSSFSGYAFCKAHSASYSVLSFQEAWLKVHYPAEFLCSVLNNYGGFYSHQEYINEAKRLGVTVRLPDVNGSVVSHSVETDGSIRLGIEGIREVSQQSKDLLLRNRSTPYTSIEDFALRSHVTAEDGRKLISIGFCDSFGRSRSEMQVLFASMLKAKDVARSGRKNKGRNTEQLAWGFDEAATSYDLSHLSKAGRFRQFVSEQRYLGYSVTSHPSEFLPVDPDVISSDRIPQFVEQPVQVLGYVSAVKPVRTKKGEPMQMLNLADATGTIDVVVFPNVFKRFYTELAGAAALKIEGIVKDSFGVQSLIASSIQKLHFADC